MTGKPMSFPIFDNFSIECFEVSVWFMIRFIKNVVPFSKLIFRSSHYSYTFSYPYYHYWDTAFFGLFTFSVQLSHTRSRYLFCGNLHFSSFHILNKISIEYDLKTGLSNDARYQRIPHTHLNWFQSQNKLEVFLTLESIVREIGPWFIDNKLISNSKKQKMILCLYFCLLIQMFTESLLVVYTNSGLVQRWT